MDVIPYESGSFYVFARAYNDNHRLYKIHMMDSFFVVRAKTNIKTEVLKWKRRLPKNIQPDCEIELTDFYTPNLFGVFPKNLLSNHFLLSCGYHAT